MTTVTATVAARAQSAPVRNPSLHTHLLGVDVHPYMRVHMPCMHAGAEALLASLRRHGVVCTEPPPPPPLRAESAVLAVLEEDGGF